MRTWMYELPMMLMGQAGDAAQTAEQTTEQTTEQAAQAVDSADGSTAGGSGGSLTDLASDPNAALEKLQEVATVYGPKIVLALIILIIGFIVAGWVSGLIGKAMNKAKVEPTLGKFFGTLAKYGVLVLVFLSVLSTLGVETTSFAAVIAAMGFAVGLAMQGTLGNFSAGVMLLFFRPFKVGQFVKVGGEAGTVDAISLFTTTLDTPDNRRIILPNGNVFGNTIENVSHHPVRRVEVLVGTEYTADLDKCREVLMQAIDAVGDKIDKSNPDRQPQVFLAELGDSSINWKVRAWVAAGDFWPVMDQLTYQVKKHLDSNDIGIPFPQRDVHLFQQNG